MNLANLTKDEIFLARVIYSETSTICSPFEVKLVCKVIMNRIGRKDFGSFDGKRTIAPSNALDVVKVKRAFSCIGDNGNTNWKAFKPTLNGAAKRACNYAHYMMQNDQESINLPTGQIPKSMNDDMDTYEEIVYYHDKTINCPAKWTNKYWKPVLLLETEHFKFYKIVKNEGNES